MTEFEEKMIVKMEAMRSELGCMSFILFLILIAIVFKGCA